MAKKATTGSFASLFVGVSAEGLEDAKFTGDGFTVWNSGIHDGLTINKFAFAGEKKQIWADLHVEGNGQPETRFRLFLTDPKTGKFTNDYGSLQTGGRILADIIRVITDADITPSVLADPAKLAKILKIKEIDGEQRATAFEGEEIALGIQKTLKDNKDKPGQFFTNTDIMKVMEAGTLCTVTEMEQDLEAGVWAEAQVWADPEYVNDLRTDASKSDGGNVTLAKSSKAQGGKANPLAAVQRNAEKAASKTASKDDSKSEEVEDDADGEEEEEKPKASKKKVTKVKEKPVVEEDDEEEDEIVEDDEDEDEDDESETESESESDDEDEDEDEDDEEEEEEEEEKPAPKKAVKRVVKKVVRK